jgi:hypothetical protein
MRYVQLRDVIDNHEEVDSFIRFREIEEWCKDNIDRTRWRFDFASTICVYGIDIPGRIFFWSVEDANTFRNRFVQIA